MQATSERLLTYEEAARHLGITVGALSSAISRRRIHPVRLPGHIRKFVKVSDLEAYRHVRDGEHQSVSEPATPREQPALPQAATVNADAILTLTREFAGSHKQATADNLTIAMAAITAEHSALITSLLGGQQFVDPKALRLSSVG